MVKQIMFVGITVFLVGMAAVNGFSNQPHSVAKPSVALTDMPIDVEIARVRKILIGDDVPSFSIKIIVNGQIWESQELNGYDVMTPCTAQFTVQNDNDQVSISIEVWNGSIQADISGHGSLTISYDGKRGSWTGDDFLGDDSGYGHASGCENGSITDADFEIWFDISGNDSDHDGLTDWEETNIYHTDPFTSDMDKDYDNDSVPIPWEDKWGYDPFIWEDHIHLDPDYDGLTNIQEYVMEEWFADPFRQDIYIEVDWMAPDENGVQHVMPKESIQYLYSAFTYHNVMLLIDDGWMGGSDEIPFDEALDWENLSQIYETYFRARSPERVGVFHSAIICHEIVFWRRPAGGMNFKRDAFVIGSAYIQKWRPSEEGMKTAHASLFLHELGHSLGLNEYIGVDNEHTRFPWQLQYWLLGNYKSCMNYRYAFTLIDYSDGTHGFLDFDDWGSLDLQRFTHR